MTTEGMKMIVYGADGSCGFGTLFGIGKDYDEAVANSAQYLEEGESLDDYDFFGLFITEAAEKEIKENGGSSIFDDKFVAVDDEILMLVSEVTVEIIDNHDGSIDQDRTGSVWITTVGHQLDANNADVSDPGYEDWAGLDYDQIIMMWDDGTWKKV